MDGFEFNKIAGAALSALLFIFSSKALLEILGAPHGPPKAGYTLPVPKGSPAAGAATQVATFNFAKVAELLANASVDGGKEVFRACTQCHTTEKGGANKLGPSLYGILDREVGKHPGFTNYSPAMAGKGGKWTWEAIATYLNDPRGTIPGNWMAYVGVKEPAELAELLVYLRTLADAPIALPK